jgi:peroxiredoxin/tetratricopeptide (TPR) repeat protein
MRLLCLCLLLVSGGSLSGQQQGNGPPKGSGDAYKQGHSLHGAAFDEGPRTKPWVMPAIGEARFPITTKDPEVQKWFDQGNALLHSFWDYEAERAFRWALKLEPENAMVYWGLARSTSGERSIEFLHEAVKRKSNVSERERLYIEALEARIFADPLRDHGDDWRERNTEYKKRLETICVKYPEDMEAKALLAYANMGDARYGTEQIIREVLTKQPDHPGAHHYRIHNWNYHEPEQALKSCKRYGEIASGIGHALHMPGHVYATVGMWHEAAIAMDSATRVEKRYMQERLTFPFNNWNYGHNRAYLSYIQEQLGMFDAAILGARQLIDAPLDPKFNSDGSYSSHSQGITSMLRALVKAERWSELLKPSTIPWRDIFLDKMNKAYIETRAHLALKSIDKAEKSLATHTELKKDLEKNKEFERLYNIQSRELKGRIALAKGDTLNGLSLLSQAAQEQFDMQREDNDPPRYPEVLYVSLGREYLAAKSPDLAARAFEKSLTLTRNDIFSLSGLVQAYTALGDRKKAEDAMSRLLFTSSGADAQIPVIERAKAAGVQAAPRDSSPESQRVYAKASLDRFGPSLWQPYESPVLDTLDPDNKPVTLGEYKGKNVILVFYLGRECLHCMNQLQEIQKKKADWSRLDTVVLAVSPNDPASNKKNLETLDLSAIRLLSDSKKENARRFKSFDDFEEMELHSTILIDKKGRVHWARTGGDPFTDMKFLEKQLERMNKAVE